MALNFPNSPTLNQIYTDSTSGFSYQWNGTVWISFSASTANNISELDNISGSFNNSTTIFPLTIGGQSVSPASTNQLLISVGGVMQNPTDDYSVSGSNIVFTTAPTNGLTFFGTLLGTALPLNTIADGSVTPVKLSTGGPLWNTSGGVYISGITTITNASGTVTIGIGTTALLVEGNARVTGILTVGSSSITLNGSTNVINVGTGLTLSSSGINVTGIITATSFVGSGSGLTGVGIGTNGSVNTTGIITATSFFGSGSGLTGVGPSSQDVTSVAGITTINLSLGNVIYFTHNTDTTVAFANTTTTQEITFIRAKDNTSTPRTITWPSSLRWNNIASSSSAVPTLSNTGRDNSVQTFSLVTRNSGINWYGWEESLYPGDNLFFFAWGGNGNGELGQDNTIDRSSPIQIPGTTWSSISSGRGFALATKTDNTLWSWGNGTSGRTGQNTTTQFSSPVQIPGTTWSSISGGAIHSLAKKTDNTLWTWGNNGSGRLGLNATTNRSSPVQIPGTTWSSISGGEEYSLATKTDNTLWGWGNNGNGQLGQNDVAPRSSPVQIPGTTWSSIDAGNNISLATKTDNTLWSWGNGNSGRLGQNTTTDVSSPIQIPGTTWSSISGGGDNAGHSLAKKTDNTLWVWGYNNNGQLGQNSTISRSSPVQIPGTSWSAISAGTGPRSIATKTDGTLWAWGNNGSGQLGQSTTIDFSSPVQIPGTSWTSISSGYGTLALG